MLRSRRNWLELFWQAYGQGGLPAALTFLLLTEEVLWGIVLGTAVFLTVCEADWRHTTPSQFMQALFYPAPLMMLAAVRSRRRAILFGLGVGLTAGIVARDGGEWFTYIVANVVQALTMAWLTTRWLPLYSTPIRRLSSLSGATIVAVSAGALLGTVSILATNLLDPNLLNHVPFHQLALHWWFGDISTTLSLWMVLFVIDLGRLHPASAT